MELSGNYIGSNGNMDAVNGPAVLGAQDLACVGGGTGLASETHTPSVLTGFAYPGALDVRSTGIINNQWIERLSH